MIYGWDLETHLIQPGLLAPPIVCHSIHSDVVGNHLFDRLAGREWCRGWLAGDDHLVGANVAFDMGCICADSPDLIPAVFDAYKAGRVHDVQIRQMLDAIAKGYVRDHGLINPKTGEFHKGDKGNAKRYSLALCVEVMLGEDLDKADTWRLSYALLEGIPIEQWPEAARRYSLKDARVTYEVFKAQEAAANAGTFFNLQDEKSQVFAAFCGHLSSLWGVRTDKHSVDKLSEEVELRHREFESNLRALGIIREGLNPATGRKWPKDKEGKKDTAKIRELVSAAYMGNPPRTDPSEKFPEGQVSTSADTLRESGGPALEGLAGDGNEKVRNTYIPLLRGGTERPINPNFNPLLATGRSSYYEPSLQVLPRKGGVRSCITARPGTVFFSVDWAAAELSAVAQACLWLPEIGFSRLGEAINAGQDPHVRLGGKILGKTYEEAIALKRAKDAAFAGIRQLCKPINFGKWGGMGPATLVLTARKDATTTPSPSGIEYAGTRFCVLSGLKERCGERKTTEWNNEPIPPTCTDCIDLAVEYGILFAQEWEEYAPYLAVAAREAREGGLVTQFVSGRLRGGLGYCQCANTKFQGLIADVAKAALCKITEECYTIPDSPLYGSRIVVFVHDEMFGESPEEKASAAAHRCAQIMNETAAEWMPDVKCVGEPALARRWYKGMEPVYKDGILIPWEPSNE